MLPSLSPRAGIMKEAMGTVQTDLPTKVMLANINSTGL